MSEFIVAGIIVITGVNWLYSRFCENVSKKASQFLPKKTQSAAGHPIRVRL